MPLLFTSPNEIYFNYYIKYVLFLIYFFFLYCVFCKSKEGGELQKALNLYLALHVVIFFTQLLVYLSTGEYIEFNNYVREVPSETLYKTKALEGQLLNIRATGAFSEPSFYAMSVVPVIFYLFYKSRGLLISLSIFSVFLSLSVAAILICLFLLLIYLFKAKGRVLLKGVLVSSVVLSSGFLLNFYEERVLNSSDYDAIESRSYIFEEFRVRGDYLNSFGAGFFEVETEPFGVTGMDGAHTRDSSFPIYLFYTLGFFGCLFFIISIWSFIRLDSLLLLFPIFLFKFHFVSGAFWIALFIISVFSYENTND